MFGLLYSLKTRKIFVPFTFDITNHGFERGSWTDNTAVEIPFTYDIDYLGFDQGTWTADSVATIRNPFSYDNRELGFELGIWAPFVTEQQTYSVANPPLNIHTN